MQPPASIRSAWERFVRGYTFILGYVGRFNTRVILSVVYAIILPFFALIALFSERPPRSARSTWIQKGPVPANSYERQF